MTCPRCGAEDFTGMCDECGFPFAKCRIRRMLVWNLEWK